MERVIHMRTMHLGPDELLVARQDRRDRRTRGAEDIARSIDAAERAMREAEPTARVIYIEPDLYVEGHKPPTAPSQVP